MGRKEFLASLNPNKPRESFTAKKGSLKIALQRAAAIGLVSLTIMGAAGCTKSINEARTTEPTTSQTMTTDDKNDCLNSPNAVLKDFKERYVEAYNKEYGTNYTSSQIELNYTQADYLYKTKNGFVTHGSKPYETQAKLDKFGDYSKISASIGNIQLYQILDKTTGKAIESYAKFFTEDGYVEDKVFSGNDLNTLLDKLNKNDSSVLENYTNLFDTVVQIIKEDKVSDSLKASYKGQIENLEKETDENIR